MKVLQLNFIEIYYLTIKLEALAPAFPSYSTQ